VRKLAYILPAGIARAQLADSFAGQMNIAGALALLCYSGVFFAAAALIRKGKVALVRG